MSIKHLYEDERPTLLLDFANSKTLDPRITFTRNSTATYVDEQGIIKTAATNEERFDHKSGECLGLLIENSSTNSLTNSTVFSGFNKSNFSVTDNVAVAPDGTTTAASIMETGTGMRSVWVAPTNTGAASNYAQSVFVKGIGRDHVCLRIYTHSITSCWETITFALIGDGSITQEESGTGSNFTNVSRTIEHTGNGWYRITLGATNPNGDIYPWLVAGCTGPTPTLDQYQGAESYTSDPVKGYFIWGAQLETGGPFATSYIPTSGATATRSADLMSITYDNFTPWFNDNEGTFVVDMEYNGGDAHLFNLYGTTGGWWAVQLLSNGSLKWGQVVTTQTLGTLTAGNAYKVAYIYGVNTIGGCIDGGTVSLRPGLTNFVPANSPNNRTYFALGNPGYKPVNHYLKRYAYYPTRLPDTTLEALTK